MHINNQSEEHYVGIYPVRNLSNIGQGYVSYQKVAFIFGEDNIALSTLKTFYQSVTDYTSQAEPNTKNMNAEASVAGFVEEGKLVLFKQDAPELELISQIKKDQDNPNWIDLHTGEGFSIDHAGQPTEYKVPENLLETLRHMVAVQKVKVAVKASHKTQLVI